MKTEGYNSVANCNKTSCFLNKTNKATTLPLSNSSISLAYSLTSIRYCLRHRLLLFVLSNPPITCCRGLKQVVNSEVSFICLSESWCYTGRFIMFSVITNICNEKAKGPTLMELFTAAGKLKKFFILFFYN
jgi:hypothetical protein